MKTTSLRHRLSAALLIASAVGGIATAGPITVPDFSFENTTNIVADGGSTFGPDVGPSWTAAGNGAVFLLNPMDANFAGTTGSPGTLPAPADGTNCLVLRINGHTGYCWQNIGLLQSNTIYTLTIAVGQDLINGGGQGFIGLVNGVNPFGTILATTPLDSTTVTAGTFSDVTLVFTTGQNVSGPLTILMQGNSGTQIEFDNVRLSSAPAPSAPTAFVPTASPGSNVYVGTLVTLHEDPAGALPLHFQWQSDNGSGGATFSNVTGATGTNLVVDTTTFTPGVPIEYQVVVTNSFGATTSGPITITAVNGQPVVITDTLPASGSDVVGSSVTFSASFDGTRPIFYQWQANTAGVPTPIPGATNSTYTLANMQVTDTGGYSLVASNSLGSTTSTEVPFIVNPTPAATNNVILSFASQIGLGGNTRFSPSWTLATNSLIRGLAPSTVGLGNFSLDASGVVGVLTDGKYGTLYPAGNGSLDFVTGGVITGPAGRYVIYTLSGSPTGFDLTNIVTYGGWSDNGRDQQRYIVYYSTIANPTNFNSLADVNFNPSNPSSVQSATRATITPATGTTLVKNVAAIKFDFSVTGAAVENGYAGYCELQAFGAPSAPLPIMASDTEPGSGSDVVGGKITFSAAFSGAASLNWQVDTGGGPVNIPGATNSTLTITNLQISDSGTYSLVASNASGLTSSSGSLFTVN
ncbi:MAG: Immunoglobulin I-set domain protein, partial [Pedosphaera sp.]|nr:Immunoglobulin I-set domain protein [Pedosphaera sp.]